jgi:hypothetical protein
MLKKHTPFALSHPWDRLLIHLPATLGPEMLRERSVSPLFLHFYTPPPPEPAHDT